MTTTRTQARAAIVAALTALGPLVFKRVVDGLPTTLDGSPIAVVRSQGTERIREARGLTTYRYRLAVTIYIAQKQGTGAIVEALLDELVARTIATISALVGGDDTTITVEPSAPPDGDVLQSLLDGTVYRAERIPVIWESEGS